PERDDSHRPSARARLLPGRQSQTRTLELHCCIFATLDSQHVASYDSKRDPHRTRRAARPSLQIFECWECGERVQLSSDRVARHPLGPKLPAPWQLIVELPGIVGPQSEFVR